MTRPLAYKRLLLKLSGEALAGPQGFGIDASTMNKTAQALQDMTQSGFEVALVIGGGNIFRGIKLNHEGFARTPADQMGMLATLMNGIALQQALQNLECDACVMSALECPRVAESYNWHKASKYLRQGKIVIFVGGTGNPYFTTDTAAALRASEIQADILIKATKVDGIYNKDPKKCKDAKKYASLTYSQMLAEKLEVMDATAVTLCMNNQVPILVFNMELIGSIPMEKILAREYPSTIVTNL